MKTRLSPLLVVLLALGLPSVFAQPGPGGPMGGGPAGPDFTGTMSKLFGENKAFSAKIEIQAKESADETTVIPGKLAFDDGKTRFEMDMLQIKNSKMPPGAAEQMKAMGMDSMVVISRPDKKANFMIYPGLKAFAELPGKESASPETVNKYKVETTELGKETVDGHPCVKNKVVITDDKGKQHESTVWNATDLKKFPVKIETAEQGSTVTMLFSDIKLERPAAKMFDTPSEFTRYDNMMALMQAEVMKRMGGAGFPPPAK